MDDLYFTYDGLTHDERSFGTNFIISYCHINNIDYPEWLRAYMKDWPRFIDECAENALFNSGIKLYNQNDHIKFFSEQVFFIMDELEGNWSVESSLNNDYYVFELESDSVAFKLRWA